ncbi:metal ABC transporter substrate-binding protein [Niallia taxi]|uniref:metal ABC transporter substrate-binding protein n=1 Tax=Niallia taxi TaxID=2499688 RepID=UPI002E1ED641|nr:metal ABC transporter substrate-binding protein [Niallia taxi]
MFKSKIFILFVVSVIFLAACNNNQNTNEKTADESLKIMTSFYPLYDFTTKIAGDRANVINLVQPGIEPHDYEPSPKDLANLNEVDLFIYNGAGYESWVTDTIKSIDTKDKKIINSSEYVDLLTLRETGESTEPNDKEGQEDKTYDPHFWLDPIRAKQIAEVIKEELIKLDPDGKVVYEENFNKLAVNFDELNSEYTEVLSNPSRKEVIVSHNAFGYLTNRYGLEQIAITGISPSDEPSPKKLKELISFANERQINYILFETLVSPKVAETVKDTIGAKSLTLNPIEGLTNKEIKTGDDYFSVMRENLATLKLATQ